MQPNTNVTLKPLTGKVVSNLGEVNGKETYRCSFTVGGVVVVVDLPRNLLAGN